MTAFGRDSLEVDALRTDRYLEALLAQRDARTAAANAAATGTASTPSGPVDLDPSLRSTIASLDRALVRVHPSFRFEERVARRLAEVADAMRVSEAAGAEGTRVPVPVALPFDPALDPADPALAGPGPVLPGVSRPLLIGALSLAGAAIVAWRFGRPVDPMTRAVRAAHQLAASQRRAGGRPHPVRPHAVRPH
ncbi:MAG TPA: hypothetical protein VEY67_05105 [Candidatus Dormibacteraeota bacterium]|nr:hypothetical protein [Candidatus Dormibacteraeota bacterium]